ncbi:AAA family ATPase [Pedobacter sp. GSP4]|uniref:AAA family ATPase n=1 Tax=Pedobacter sp. GSP4 TaxID=3453716 RepID=UPI003EEC5689
MPQFKFNIISRTDIENSLGGAQMIYAIDYDGPENLLVTGCAGSGKTTVSLMRAERLINLEKNVHIITFHDLLVTNLKNSATKELAPNILKYHGWYYRESEYTEVDGVERKKVEKMTYEEMAEELKNYDSIDEFIIDEGQNFPEAFHRILLEKCKVIAIGADNAQKVHKGLTTEQITEKMKLKGAVNPVQLQYNYRNTYEIYNFARYFLPLNERVNNERAIEKIPKGRSVKPTFFVVPDQDSEIAQLYTLLKDAGDRNVAVIVYHIDEVRYYYEAISGLGISCSSHHNQDHVNDLENVLVTTYKSAQGLEFQTVIMPNMETVGGIYYQTGQHYYIGSTRAKENLFLLAKGDNLPEYFNKFDVGSYQLTKTGKLTKPIIAAPKTPGYDDDLPF